MTSTAEAISTPVPGQLEVAGPQGRIDCLVTGEGSPTTLFVHGLTGSIAQTRPFGSGVRGTRVFMHLRGHGGTAVPSRPGGEPDPGGYPELASDLAAVIAAVGATRALGVSFGAGALLALLASTRTPLERLVLCLPPSAAAGGAGDSDTVRDDVQDGFAEMADAVDAVDVERLARGLLAQQPSQVRGRPDVRVWARRHAGELIAGRANGLGHVLRAWPGRAALPDPARHRLPGTLVLAQDGDPVHPLAAALAWADLLHARLEVLPAGSLPWTARGRVRALIAGHLNG